MEKDINGIKCPNCNDNRLYNPTPVSLGIWNEGTDHSKIVNDNELIIFDDTNNFRKETIDLREILRCGNYSIEIYQCQRCKQTTMYLVSYKIDELDDREVEIIELDNAAYNANLQNNRKASLVTPSHEPYTQRKVDTTKLKTIRKVLTRIKPKSAYRHCPAQVPSEIAKDYIEAGLILDDSPTASATLSRRCLQNLLRKQYPQMVESDLFKEIENVIQKNDLPTTLSQDLHALRSIGNYGAHPTKIKNTGEIVDVEPCEAEYCLNLLEQLFNHYYVTPNQRAQFLTGINAKLIQAGKPTINNT